MEKKQIPFNRPYVVGKELFYIAQAVIEGRKISGDGHFTALCQNWLQESLNVPKALLTHSCTASLEMAAILCDIQPADEIIMPSFTFVSTANAFVLRGGVPVFVDIKNDTLNIDENLIEAAITSKTKAIVPVHYAGSPCNLDKISEIAKKYNLMVIEDAAQGLLSTYKGNFLGSLSDLGCLSFHETKNIISGEGGALLINNEQLAERAEIIWEKGTNRKKFFRGHVDKYTWVDIGSSYLPSDIIAAFLYAQLENAEKIIKNRCESFDFYMSALKGLEDAGKIRLPNIENYGSCNGHIMYIICNSLADRISLIDHLASKHISSVFHYVPLHSSPMGIKCCKTSGKLDVTDKISDTLLRLPLYYGMTTEELERVVEEIKLWALTKL